MGTQGTKILQTRHLYNITVWVSVWFIVLNLMFWAGRFGGEPLGWAIALFVPSLALWVLGGVLVGLYLLRRFRFNLPWDHSLIISDLVVVMALLYLLLPAIKQLAFGIIHITLIGGVLGVVFILVRFLKSRR